MANKRKTVLLILLTILILGGLGYAFGYYYESGPYGLVFALVIALLMSLGSYYTGDKVALAVSGARAIKKEDSPYVYRMVENLCITAGLPMPKIYIIEDNAMNAFATGRDPQHSSIALTTGIIQGLENEELEGVIAHELSHIQNYDIRVMMIVATLVGVIVLLGDFMLRFQLFGGKRRSSSEGGSQAQMILFIAALVFMILAPLIGQLIKLAISRKREFLADASGSMLTRYPQGLASALRKIGAQNRPMDHASNATAHLFFSSPFGSGRGKKFLARMFSTHPPIEERIKALDDMLQQS